MSNVTTSVTTQYGAPYLYYANIGISGAVMLLTLLASIRAAIPAYRTRATGGALTRVRLHLLLLVGVLARCGAWVACYLLRDAVADSWERYVAVVTRAVPSLVFFASFALLALFWAQLLSSPHFAASLRCSCECRLWAPSFIVAMTLAALGFVALVVVAAVLPAKGTAWLVFVLDVYVAAITIVALALVIVSSSCLIGALPSLGRSSREEEEDDAYDPYGVHRGSGSGGELDQLGASYSAYSANGAQARVRRAAPRIDPAALRTLCCSTCAIGTVASLALIARAAAAVFFALPLARIFGIDDLIPISDALIGDADRARLAVDSILPILCEFAPTLFLIAVFSRRPPKPKVRPDALGGGRDEYYGDSARSSLL